MSNIIMWDIIAWLGSGGYDLKGNNVIGVTSNINS